MSAMVKRVARAIYGDNEWNGPWEEADEHERKACLSEAVAAIKAMREPTDAMCVVGCNEAVNGGGGSGYAGTARCYSLMIDEALK